MDLQFLINHNPEDIKMPFKKGIGEMVNTLCGKLLSQSKSGAESELSEPFFICYFLFSLFITYLLTLLLIGGRQIR
jgi:hypothetical protein